MTIYKILTAPQWQCLHSSGTFPGAPVDLADGYIHFSTRDQVQGTLDKHFAGQEGLVLAACDAEAFGDDLKWEVSRGGAKFPHLYGRALTLDDVIWHATIPFDGDQHAPDFP